MSTITTPTRSLPAADWIPSPLARLTVDQYEALINSGVFTERDRFQLINGLLVAQMPKKRPHMIACDKVGHMLEQTIPVGWHVMPDGPVRLPPGSEPQPEFALVRGKPEDYPIHAPEGGRPGACCRGLVLDPRRRSQHGRRLRGRPDPRLLDRQARAGGLRRLNAVSHGADWA